MADPMKPAKKTTAKKTQAVKVKPKPAPAAPAKKFRQIAAALEVLKTATEPMTCKQMVRDVLLGWHKEDISNALRPDNSIVVQQALETP